MYVCIVAWEMYLGVGLKTLLPAWGGFYNENLAGGGNKVGVPFLRLAP